MDRRLQQRCRDELPGPPPAVAAASAGDTLIIRTGFYSPFSTAKGLTLLGEGAVQVGSPFGNGAPAVEVKGLPQGQSFVATNLTARVLPTGSSAINLDGNAGQIHLQHVSIDQPATPPATMGCRVFRCRSVTITGGSFVGYPAVAATESTLAVVGATLVGGAGCGGSPWCFMPGATGLLASDGVTDLSRTSVQGGNAGTSFSFAAPAISLSGGTLTVTGDSSTQIVAGAAGGALPVDAIATAGGSVVADTTVAIRGTNGGVAVGGTAAIVRRRVVSLAGAGGPLGGALSAEVVSPAGDLFWLIAGFPAPPVFTPFGELAIHPLLVVLLAAGVQAPTERFAWNATVPNIPALRGGVIGLQAANLYQASGLFDYSNLLVVLVE